MLVLAAARAFSEMALKPSPGGSMNPFCEQLTVTSTFHSSCRIIDRAQRGDRIHQQQRGMADLVDRGADVADPAGDAGGGLVVHHHHRLDGVLRILRQLRLDRGGVGAVAPVARHEIHLDAPARRHLPPQRGEMAGLDHQDLVARRQRVDDRRFPGAGARRGKNDDRAGGLEDLLAAFEHRLGELGELRAAVVDDRHVHGAEHAIRHRAGAGNLQKMASLVLRHGFLA